MNTQEIDTEFDARNDENVRLQEELVDCLSKLDMETCPPVCYADRRKIDAQNLRRELYATMHDLNKLRSHVNSENMTREDDVIKELQNHIRLQQKGLELVEQEMSLLSSKLEESSDCDDTKDELSLRLQGDVISLRRENREISKAIAETENTVRGKHANGMGLNESQSSLLRQSISRGSEKLHKREVSTAETAASWGSSLRRRRALFEVALN